MIHLILVATLAHAQTADDIIAEARKTQRVDNGIQQIRMVLTHRNGSSRERHFEMQVRKDGEVVRSYVRFSHPTDVAGTQLVMVDHPEQVDEQLLYMPALKRTNRIAGKARGGSFMGSDFSFEDLEISDASDAVHTLAEDGEGIWIIDTVPGGDSSYEQIRSHVTKADHVPRKVEFYKNGAVIKVLEIQETAVDGQTVVPTHTVMRNLQRGSQTDLHVESYRLNVPESEVPLETFTAGFMERGG